jgi:hypothetical protein
LDGAIYRVTSLDANPQVSRVTLLPEVPELVIEHPTDPERLFIISRSFLISIRSWTYKGRRNDMLHIKHWRQDWAGVNPSSAVFYRGHLIIGSKEAVTVVKLDPQDYVESARYFEPK